MIDAMIYDVVPRSGVIDLGKQVEGLVTRVVLPNIRRGAGAVQLVHQRSDDREPYLVPVTEDGESVYWLVSRSDTAFPGRGQAELQWLGENGAVAKSITYQTNTTRSMTEPGPEPDEPLRPYTQAVARDAQTAKNAAASATEAARSAEASAGQAGLSAATAAEAARNAEAIVGQAGQSAQSAQAAALAAAQNAAAAETAEEAANQAKTGAEAARTEAQTAKTAAEKAAQEAKAAQAGAVEAKTAAETAQAKAEEAAQGVAADREQIGANTAGLEAAQQDVTALKAENTALKASTARTARSLDYLWKKSKGIIYDTETVTGAGSSVTVPIGAMDYAALRKLGGMSQRDEENSVLIDAPVDEVRVSNAAGDNTNTCPIPQAIRDLCPDYGMGVSADCYNYIDFAAKQYHHRVGQVDLGTLEFDVTTTVQTGKKRYVCRQFGGAVYATNPNTVPKYLCPTYDTVTANGTYKCVDGISSYQSSDTNKTLLIYDTDFAAGDTDTAAAFNAQLVGVPLYYELATPEIIDLAAVWPDDDFGILRVEAGGTINLHYPALDDGYELAVPSETEIMVDVAKVVQTNG